MEALDKVDEVSSEAVSDSRQVLESCGLSCFSNRCRCWYRIMDS